MAQRLSSRLLQFVAGVSVVAALAAVLFLPVGQVDAQRPMHKDQYKHQVEHLEQVWRTDELNGDADAIDKLLSDDYVGITMTGQVVTKEQQLERLRRRVTVLSRLDLTDVHVKLIGTTAIVTSLAEVNGTSDGKPFHGTFRYTRVYSRQSSGRWLVTNFEATRVGPLQPPTSQQPEAGGTSGVGTSGVNETSGANRISVANETR